MPGESINSFKLERNKRTSTTSSKDARKHHGSVGTISAGSADGGGGGGGVADVGSSTTTAATEAVESKKKMNGLSFSELCCLFCCPPCPGRIASKLAFLPPEPSYDLKADDAANSKFTLNLLDRADWQYGDREKECFEAFFARSSRGNRIACLFVKCSTNAR